MKTSVNSMANSVDFFMGALGPKGFQGYFDWLDTQEQVPLYLIKAGPGCGKSTLMTRLAQASPLPVECIHCSSDPDSLDGVIFSRPRAAIIDATAPHVVEPAYPGAVQKVVDLHHVLDNDYLTAHRGEIVALFRRCSALQEQAGRSIRAAAALLEDSRRLTAPLVNEEKLLGWARRLGSRRLPRTGNTGSESIRLLSAVTPKGRMVFMNTVETLASETIVLHDEQGAAAPLALALLRDMALERGYSIITCPCPLRESVIDHLFLPELRLAFLTGNSWHPMTLANRQNVHCTRFLEKGALRSLRARLRFDRKAAAELLELASAAQRQAKASHDELESFYRTAADFSRLDEIAEQLTKTLFA